MSDRDTGRFRRTWHDARQYAPRYYWYGWYLIGVGDRVVDDELKLPHPAAHRRSYILRPWLDVDPEAYLPGHGLVVELLDKLDESGIQRRDDLPIYI